MSSRIGRDWGSHALLGRMYYAKTTLKIPWQSLKLNVHALDDSAIQSGDIYQKEKKVYMSIKWFVHECSSVLFVMGREPGNNPNIHQKVTGWTNFHVHTMAYSAGTRNELLIHTSHEWISK